MCIIKYFCCQDGTLGSNFYFILFREDRIRRRFPCFENILVTMFGIKNLDFRPQTNINKNKTPTVIDICDVYVNLNIEIDFLFQETSPEDGNGQQ